MQPEDSAEDLAAIVERVRGGDRAAEGTLHRLLAPDLTAYVKSQLGIKLHARLDAQDIVQETISALIVVLRKGEREIRNLRGFCRTIARRVMYREAQRRSVDFRRLPSARSSSVGPGIEPVDRGAGPKTVVLRRERTRRLRKALRSLPPRAREILRLRFERTGKRMGFKEIGEQLDMTAAAAEKAYQRALERLEEELRRAGGGLEDTTGWLE